MAFVLAIGPLIFLHEMGHYLAGRLFGVKAEEFSIGFGRELFGWNDRRGTRWKVSLLPLGGYVRFAGDMGVSSRTDPAWIALPAEERARTFPAKPLWQRAIIVAAGPVTNFLIAIAILSGFAMAFGEVRVPAVVGTVVPGSPAAAAGLRVGDRIVGLDDQKIDQFREVAQFVMLRPGEAVQIEVDRQGVRRDVSATIATRLEKDRFGNSYRIGQLGVAMDTKAMRVEPVSIVAAPVVAAREVGASVATMGEVLGQIISGRRSVAELGGLLQIAKASGEQLSLGIGQFLLFVALVSINLAVINLLPVPMLDGGHLLFYAIEAVQRRPVGQVTMEWAFRGGLAAVLALMLMVTFNDLGALGVWSRLAGLIG